MNEQPMTAGFQPSYMKALFQIFVLVFGSITTVLFAVLTVGAGIFMMVSFGAMLLSGGKHFPYFLAALVQFAISLLMCLAPILWIRDLTRSADHVDEVNKAIDYLEPALAERAKRFFTMSVWQIGIVISFILFAVGLLWTLFRC